MGVVRFNPTQSSYTTQQPLQEATGTDFHISLAVHVFFFCKELCQHVHRGAAMFAIKFPYFN